MKNVKNPKYKKIQVPVCDHISYQSRLETGGGEGVEIVKNEPFTNQPHGPGGKFDKGQYTYKVYKVASKVPKYIR